MSFTGAVISRFSSPVAPLVLALVLSLSGPLAAAQAAQGTHALQGGQPIDDNGNVRFAQSPSSQFPLIWDAGADWVRINFRLGKCYSDWTAVGCNGKTALQVYDEVVTTAHNNNLRVLALLSNETWHGGPAHWTANNAEHTGGSGDNPYIRGFAQNAAGVLASHFKGRVSNWEVWNEPNAWTSLDSQGNPTGGTYLYPSNFAWLMRRSYDVIKAAQPTATIISGGLFAHDGGGVTATVVEGGETKRVIKHGRAVVANALQAPQEGDGSSLPACSNTVVSGAEYLCATYAMGVQKASWKAGAYPLDQVGQHLYIDQDTMTSSAKLQVYLQDLRNAYLAHEGAATPKQTQVTEIGWTTASVSPEIQAANLRTAYETFRSTSYVGRAYWFSIQDVPVADLFYGLVDVNGAAKPAFAAYQEVSGVCHLRHLPGFRLCFR